MNRIVLVTLFGGAAMIGAAPAHGQTRPGFEVWTEALDYSYRERRQGDVVARDDGGFGSLGASYVKPLQSSVFLRARFNVAMGSVDYAGADGEDRIDDVEQNYGQFELHLGKDIRLAKGATLTPYFGMGGRYLEDESGGKRTNTGRLGYDREVSYTYVPIGAAARIPLAGKSFLTLSAQYNWVVDGDVRSRLSSIDPRLPDIKVKLDKGSGFELAALGSTPMGRKILSFGPFLRSWNVDRSETFVLVDPEGSGDAIEFFEPDSKTTEVGLRLSLAF